MKIQIQKSIPAYIIVLALVLGLIPFITSAQMMLRGMNTAGLDWHEIVAHTEKEEAEGELIYDDLARGTRSCEELDDDDFALLGEYFMGEMTGDSHTAMNAMLIRMHGEEGEEAMHVTLGKRTSLCTEVTNWSEYGFMMGSMMGFGGAATLGLSPTCLFRGIY